MTAVAYPYQQSVRLQEAEEALHRLLTGGRKVRVRDASGREITYAEADSDRLKAYVEGLRLEVDRAQGTAPPAVRRPLRIVF